jgi:tRNA(fMet)-specific endonuclease VapC
MTDVTLDTNVIVDLIRMRESARHSVAPFLNPAASHVVFGELLLGGMKTRRPGEMNRIFRALEGISILNADAATAEIYARLRWQVEQDGFPIPQNDLWIAAVSIQAGVPLVTRDRHFRRIPELKVLEYP